MIDCNIWKDNRLDYNHWKYCPTCGKKFYKEKRDSVKRWIDKKYCSWLCRRYPKFGRNQNVYHSPAKNEEFYIQCWNCGKIFQVSRWQFYKPNKRFCSRSCAMKYNNPSCSWTEDRRRYLSDKQKKKVEAGEWVNPVDDPEVRKKISRSQRLRFKLKGVSPATKSKMSKISADRLLKGKNPNLGHWRYGKQGWFYSEKNGKEIHYRSQFEKRAYEILEEMDDVEQYTPEPFRIAYELDGVVRYYIPDILVVYKDGSKELIEIKPMEMLKYDEFLAKAKFAKEYCENNGIDKGYSIWTQEMLFKKVEDENDRLPQTYH